MKSYKLTEWRGDKLIAMIDVEDYELFLKLVSAYLGRELSSIEELSSLGFYGGGDERDFCYYTDALIIESYEIEE